MNDKTRTRPPITRVQEDEEKKTELQKKHYITHHKGNEELAKSIKEAKNAFNAYNQHIADQIQKEVPPMDYGEYLRTEREKLGLTQAQLANKLGKPTWLVRRWEKNQAYPSSKSRQKLATLMKEEASGLQVAEIQKVIEELFSRQVNEDLKQFSIDLSQTILEVVKSLQASTQTVEIRKMIEELLSKNGQVNEDLKQFFIGLSQTILEALKSSQASTQINISGPVQGLTVGKENTITQTFNDFPQDKLRFYGPMAPPNIM